MHHPSFENVDLSGIFQFEEFHAGAQEEIIKPSECVCVCVYVIFYCVLMHDLSSAFQERSWL